MSLECIWSVSLKIQLLGSLDKAAFLEPWGCGLKMPRK